MDKTIIFEIISQLHNYGNIVVGIVGDMGSGNTKLWRELYMAYDGNWVF